jgi:hypothetical protein
MIVLGLPRTASELRGNCGTVHVDPPVNLRLTSPPLVQCLDLDTVIDC